MCCRRAIPLPTIAEVQLALTKAVQEETGIDQADLKQHLRTGTVVTTGDRNWELRFEQIAKRLNQSRAIAIDMESATVAELTGLTLNGVGAELSITGNYDSDPATDFDYYGFSLVESGTEITDLRVRIAYGCNFTGATAPGASPPEVALYDDTGAQIAFFDGNDNYDDINGSGLFGFGEGMFSVAGASGTNTYHIRLDDGFGAGWCMDYVVYVEVADNTRPAVCLGAPATSALADTDIVGGLDATTGVATLPINLTDAYQNLQEADLTLTPVVGTGTLQAGSLAGADDTFTVGVVGAALGDSYTLTVAGGTDTCGTVFAGGSINVTNIIPLECVGVVPGNVNVDTTLIEGFTEANGTATMNFAFDGPFQLEEADLTLTPTNGGAGVLIPGSLLGGGATWSVQASGVAIGDTYDLTIAARTDACGAITTATTIPVNAVAPRFCPVPAPLQNHFANPDACDAGTNSTLATASQTGFSLTTAGDQFSVGGVYDSDSIGGSDNDYYAFEIVSDGVSTYNLDVSIGYGCNFQGTGVPGGFSPIVEIRNAGNGQVGQDVVGNHNYDDINGTGAYGLGQAIVPILPADNPVGTNTFYVWIDDDVGSNWCMDYTIYVTLDSVQ